MVNFVMVSFVIAAVFIIADTFKNTREKMVFASTMLTVVFVFGPFAAQFVMMIIIDIMNKMLKEGL
ncbi:MAG: hypothetical protein ABIM30_00020 [candidate division WOR-3 bacterium]